MLLFSYNSTHLDIWLILLCNSKSSLVTPHCVQASFGLFTTVELPTDLPITEELNVKTESTSEDNNVHFCTYHKGSVGFVNLQWNVMDLKLWEMRTVPPKYQIVPLQCHNYYSQGTRKKFDQTKRSATDATDAYCAYVQHQQHYCNTLLVSRVSVSALRTPRLKKSAQEYRIRKPCGKPTRLMGETKIHDLKITTHFLHTTQAKLSRIHT